jgi:hypothetical protein
MTKCERNKVSRMALIIVASIIPVFLTCAFALADAGNPPAATQAPAIFWITLVIVTAFIALLMLSLIKGLMGSQEWTFADALSEESDPQPSPPPAGKPVMVASSSRLIAFLGLIVILALFLGVGYYLLWCLFTQRELKELDYTIKYFYSGLVLFAPYIVNKFSDAFSIFKPAAKQ